MVDATSSVSNSGVTSAGSKTTAMGKDDFLQLLVAQLKNQDPLKPMDNTEFVSQLAQFSSLEQLTNMSDQMGKLDTDINSMSGINALTMLGKDVKYVSNVFEVTGSGTSDVSYAFDKTAEDVTAKIYDSTGALVRTMSLGAKEAGLYDLAWDGMGDNGQAAVPGTYTVSITGKDASGGDVNSQNYASGTVSGVTYQSGVPYLTIGGSLIPIANVLEVSGAQTATGN